MSQRYKLLGMALALLGLILLLTSCGSEEESASYVAMNEWHALNDWEINVSHAEYMDDFGIPGHDGYFIPRDGFRFVVIHLSVRNTGDETDTFVPTVPAFGTLRMTMDIGEERPWVPSNMVLYTGGIARGRFDILNTEVEPGETIEGFVGFEVRIEILENPDSVLDLHFSQAQIGQQEDDRLVYNLRDS